MIGLGLSLIRSIFVSATAALTHVVDNLKLYFNFEDGVVSHASAGSTSFDGSNDYIEAGASNAIITGNNVTYSFWIKNTDSDESYVLQNQKGAGSSNLGIRVNSTAGDVVALVWNGSSHGIVSYNPSINDSKWHHIAFTTTASAQVLYIDGVSVATGTLTFANASSTDKFQIGRLGSNSTFFGGSLANVGIWSRALSASEIQGIMYKQYADLSSAEQVSLVSWYDLGSTSLGSELITGDNSTFTSGLEDWATGNNWNTQTNTDGKMVLSSNASNQRCLLSMSLVAEKHYEFTYDASAMSGTITINAWVSSAYYVLGTLSEGTANSIVFTMPASAGASFYIRGSASGAGVTLDNLLLNEVLATDSHSTNEGEIYGATTNATIYGGNAPSKPRILDSAPDVVDNYGTLKSGTALSFDGTNDYVDFFDSETVHSSFQGIGNNNDYSIFCWIKTTGGTGSGAGWKTDNTIIELRQEGSTGIHVPFSFGVSNNMLELGRADDGSSSEEREQGTITVNDGFWHLVGFTVDDNAYSFYVDGVVDSSGSFATVTGDCSVASASSNMQVGVRSKNSGSKDSNFFNGKMSSVKVFNSALTLSEIQEMYLNPEQILPTGVSSSNLKLWLPLQEGSGTTNYDGSGNNNDGTISGATWVKAETDIAQTALIRSNYTSSVLYPEGLTSGQDIQGTTLANTDENVLTLNGAEYVEIPDSEVLSFGDGSNDTAFSVEAWLKIGDATNFQIISKGIYSSTAEYKLFLNASNHLKFQCFDESVSACYIGRRYNTDISSTVEGLWTHVVATYDGNGISSGIKIYLNGARIDDTNDQNAEGSYVAMENLATNVHIGRYDSTYSDGLIDDVRIYSDALTSAEVTNNYNAGLSSHS